jgi:hypothetical protein
MPIVTLETGQKLTFPEGTTSDQINFAVDEFVTKNGISPQEAPAQQAPAALQQPAQEPQSFQEQIKPYRRSASEDAKTMISALYSGAEDLGTGIYQAAANLGFDFSGAKKVLSMVRPDLREQIQSLTPEDISQVLADKQKAKNAAEADKPLGFKAIKEVVKIIPFLAAGSTTGKLVSEGLATGGKVAQTLAPIVGLAASGTVGGAEMAALSPQEEAGLKNRALETAKGAATGAAFGAGLGVGGKLVAQAKKVPSLLKNIFTKDTAEEVGAKAMDPESAKLALKELQDKPSNKPLTAVDIQNPEFKTFARSVVNKYPQAREIVKNFTEGRNKEAFARINNDLRIISKIDNADDYTKQISDTQKSLASPLYAEAEADRTIVPKFEFKEVKTTTSPQTTTVSEGVKSFKTDSSTKTKTDFINKYNLQSKSRDVEKPLVSKEEKELFKQGKGSFEGSSKEELFNIADRYKTATQDLKKYAPKSPLQVIKESGGIADYQGELASLGITNKTLPGLLRKEGTAGVGIDDVGQKLYEAGYFKERPSVNEVLDFLDKELRNTTKGNRATTFFEDSTKYNEAKQFLDEADSLDINIDAINKLKKITPQTAKTGIAGIKAGSSYDKRDLFKKGIEEFQNTLRKQTTRIEEGGKIVNVRKEITNLNQMSPKSMELAKQFDELENNKIYSKFKTQARERLDEDIPDNSVAMLHKIRKRIDANTAKQYDSLGKPIDKDAIADNTKLREKIDGLISEVSPTFKVADNVFKPLAIRKDAVEFGKEFSKYKPSEIIKKVNEFTSKSGLKRQDILDDIKVGAKDTIVKDVQKLIKFDSSNIPTQIQVKTIIENQFKRDQLKTFLDKKDYREFIDNIDKEALFNKVSESLRLDKSSTQEERTNFILRAFNGLISYATSGYGKYAATINATKAGEQFLVKNYRGLNSENAKKIATIFINKEASEKYLNNIIYLASKNQKIFVTQAINDLKPLMIATNLITQSSMNGNNDAQAAETENMTEEQIRNQLIQRQQQEPVLMSGINPQAEAQKIKNRYYR